MILAAEDLVVRYPGVPREALAGVTLAVAPGEVVAIAGPNGSGKTTLLRAMLGTVPLAAGRVTLQGRPLQAWSRRDIARMVGALPQREEPAFPMSVREAITLGRWSHLGPFASPRADDDAAVASAIDRCDVGALVDRSIDSLSGGEWQRVRVARTLAAMPRVLLLDEPSAALDVAHEMALFELLAGLAAEGLAIVIITHQLNLAARFAGRIVLMKEGVAVRDAPPAEVMTEPVLSSLFDWPVSVHQLSEGAPQFVAERRPHGTRPA
jgi:iron complex transport system ATP-binding protein